MGITRIVTTPGRTDSTWTSQLILELVRPRTDEQPGLCPVCSAPGALTVPELEVSEPFKYAVTVKEDCGSGVETVIVYVRVRPTETGSSEVDTVSVVC